MARTHPLLSGFKPLDLEDKEAVSRFLRSDPPEISELTFTNLFMWRHHYRPCWRIYRDCLLVVLHPADGGAHFGLPPQGPGDKAAALNFFMQEMDQAGLDPLVCRAAADFVEKFAKVGGYEAVHDPDNSDYIYLSNDLIRLSGKGLHKKKNHLNKFIKTYKFEYRALDEELVNSVLFMQEAWCRLRGCEENPGLLDEDHAVFEALRQFDNLDYIGGVILMENKVEAFSLGEVLE